MSAVPISGTKELASRTPCIVWHTRSDTFVLIPLLELTRAVAQTVPDFFLILPFAGGLHQCRGRVSLYCPHVLGGRGVVATPEGLSRKDRPMCLPDICGICHPDLCGGISVRTCIVPQFLTFRLLSYICFVVFLLRSFIA